MLAFFNDQLEDLTRLRRELHRHPELGFNEHRTAARVEAELKKLNLPCVKGLGGTGIVATVVGAQADNGRRIGLRADMDALPIHELNDHDHCSEVDGCMHACGHDGHTTMLLGAARYLASHRDFAGTIYLVFQPAEEGLGGAHAMVKDGLFERFPMDEIYGLHNWPYMPEGSVAVTDGAIMAATDRFDIRIQGVGGHGGATPHLTVDPIRVSGALINALHTIIGREIDPQEAAVLSLGAIKGGQLEAFNVIPDLVQISGTVRTFSAEIQDQIEASIRRICKGVGASFGAEISLDYQRIFPATLNTPRCAQLVRETVRETLGGAALNNAIKPSLGGEDFAFMLNVCPGSYFFLGSGKDENTPPLHNPNYDFNDDVIPTGACLLASLALRALSQNI